MSDHEEKSLEHGNGEDLKKCERKILQDSSLSKYLLQTNRSAFKLKIVSLLFQMASPVVRADFLSGAFGREINIEVLLKLDKIRWTLIPRWQAVSSSARFLEAANHFDCLLDRSHDVFHFEPSGECTVTYSEWLSMLELIANNGYWTNVSAEERCTHANVTYDEASIQFGSGSRGSGKNALERSSESKLKSPDKIQDLFSNKHTSVSRSKKRNEEKKRRVKIEEVVISSTSSSSSENPSRVYTQMSF